MERDRYYAFNACVCEISEFGDVIAKSTCFSFRELWVQVLVLYLLCVPATFPFLFYFTKKKKKLIHKASMYIRFYM